MSPFKTIINEGLPGGGGGPCSLVPFQNCPMFPCSHTFSECFRTVIFRIFSPVPKHWLMFPCSLRYFANVPLFPKTHGRPSSMVNFLKLGLISSPLSRYTRRSRFLRTFRGRFLVTRHYLQKSLLGKSLHTQ